MKSHFRDFKDDEDGVMTLEASMLFPAILIATMMMIFFSMVIFYKSVLQFEANRIADQVAYVWNNSSKDVETGEFEQYTTDNGDGLYWRLTSNNFFEQFGFDAPGNDLVGAKERNELVSDIPGVSSGSVTYSNGLIGSQIQVELTQPIPMPSSVTSLLGTDVLTAKASRAVTEPVELVRDTQFAMYFFKKAGGYGTYVKKFFGKSGS